MRSEAAPSDWRRVVLDEVCSRVTSGGTPARDKGDRYYVAAGHRWVKTKELLDGQIHDTEEHITETALAESAARLLPPRTVLVAMYGATVGQLGILANEAACNQACCALLVDEAEADHRFVFYALLHNRWHLKQAASGAAQQNINARLIKNLRILLPPRDEQERIAWVLRALDDKIDSNLRLARLLEETVATLFRARFVDFLGIEEFEESEIGRVPVGWDVVPAGEALSIVGGATPSTKESRFWEDGTHCWATPKDLSGHSSPVLTETIRHITDAGVRRISSGLLPPNTVLLSSRAPIGYTVICKVPVAVNQGFIAIPPSERVPNEYVLFWIRHNLDTIRVNAGGTTFAEISKRQFRPIPMLLPPAARLHDFADLCRPVLSLIASLDRARRQLGAVRDALLPKLVSGAIRIPDTADLPEFSESTAEALATTP